MRVMRSGGWDLVEFCWCRRLDKMSNWDMVVWCRSGDRRALELVLHPHLLSHLVVPFPHVLPNLVVLPLCVYVCVCGMGLFVYVSVFSTGMWKRGWWWVCVVCGMYRQLTCVQFASCVPFLACCVCVCV